MDYIKSIRPYLGHQKIILCCAGALIVRDNQVLLQRRKDNNKWGLIGGLLELDETFFDAAKREVKEETGLDVEFDYLVGIYHNYEMMWANKDEAHTIGVYYKAHIVNGTPRVDEESYELKWFNVDDTPELFAEDHRLALEAYKKGIKLPIPNENKKG